MKEHATILIVDDDENILENMVDMLQVDGYHVLKAENGLQAIEVLQQHTPDLIISDIAMPVMDGYQFFEAVRENSAWVTIPFIFLTARGEVKDIRLGYGLGADHYVTKPFEPEDLLITVRNRLERMAVIQAAAHDEVEQTKRQIMTVVGHELRTPLTIMYGYISLLQEGFTDMSEDVLHKILADTQGGVERLTRLIEDLLMMVNIDSGLLETYIRKLRVPVKITWAIDSAMRKLRPRAEKLNIGFTLPLDESLEVSGIPDYIESIYERLIDNAIKFGKPGGHIWITARAEDGCGVVSVQDNGLGIPLDQQSDLFTRFRQIDREKREQQEVGVGLAIVEGLTRLHGGRIELSSLPGEGSTFTIWLPSVAPLESETGGN